MMMLSERLQSKDINKTIPKFTEDFYEPDYNTSGDSEQQSAEYSPQSEEQLGGTEEE